MKDQQNSNLGSLPRRPAPNEVGQWDGAPWETVVEPRLAVNGAEERAGAAPAGNGYSAQPFSPWPLVEMVVRSWHWLLLGGCVLAGLGLIAGMNVWHNRYTANVQLLRFDTPNNSELFKPRQLSEQTFASMLRSPQLLRDVSALTKPALSPDQLASRLMIEPERGSDVVTVSFTATDPKTAINVANLFANEAVRFSKQLQANEAAAASIYYTNQLADLERERAALVADMKQAARTSIRPSQMNDRFQAALVEKLQAARADLVNLLVKYKDAHPAVIEQNAKIDELQRQLNTLATNTTAGAGSALPARGNEQGTNVAALPPRLGPSMEKDSDFEILRTQLQAIETSRAQLVTRQREAQLFQKDPPGYAQLFAPATAKNVVVRDRRLKIILLAVFGGVMGMLGTAVMLVGVELLDQRVKTAADVKRVTRLPLLATLGNLHRIDQATQEYWAFRTWTALQNRLSPSPNYGLVCGVTSARSGEGRTTWVSLLARAASQCGFRVLTIGTIPETESEDRETRQQDREHRDYNLNGTALTTRVLSSPAVVTEKLTGDDPQPFVQIPMPGWVWNLERRKEWQCALNQWSKIENVVILVELPPACVPEAVLLGENLPNLLWLTGSGAANASESRMHLETLRHARCNLVGAVLNQEAAPPLEKRFERWVSCITICVSLFCCAGRAADPDPQPPAVIPPAVTQTNGPKPSFSVTSAQRGAWQQRFTLGPGDVLNISLFGQPELSRSDVFVGPDGRVSFLQAQDLLASGLTVDELRAKFDEELAKYYRTPRTMITPVSFQSKKYYVLGRVVQRGVFTLDRPLTVIEAVARAKGLETGLLPDNRNVMDLADLQRSFLMRQGKRVGVNFEKLFQEGDLSQNIALEPGDYLYFAAANLKQVYVLGEVNVPGPLPYTQNLTAIGAVSARGGFTQRAYKGRVLVIRGSLNRPQTFVVDMWKATEGRALDFKLQPKDIVYVNYRPFIKAEDLLDLGITAFLQSLTVEWTGLNIDPQRTR